VPIRTRAVCPSVQYATPRCTYPKLAGVPCTQILGSWTHNVRPLVASMAATWLIEVLTYRTPPIMSGVAWFSQVWIVG